jgi:hypothetical protein
MVDEPNRQNPGMQRPAQEAIKTDLARVEADVAVEQAVAAQPGKNELIVRTWINEQLLSSPVSQNTAAWNHLQAAIPQLVAALDSGV